MTRAMQSSFLALRSWDGSQARAFEELSYQLLKSDAPSGSYPIRTGNPDGGVEWYATLPDGGEWGWQAKFIQGIDALLAAMSESVKRVVLERPQLAKLTFVIPWNLATGTRGRTRTSQRQKYEAKVAAWKRSIASADRIDFELVQESDLLDRLSLPEHRGRAWFWWADPQLSTSWFRDRLREQSDAAGERYRPDLQVDVPIEEDLKALGCGGSVFEEFERLRRRVISAGRELRLTPSGPKNLRTRHNALIKSTKVVLEACDRTVLQAEAAVTSLGPVMKGLEKLLDDIRDAQILEQKLESEWSKLPEDAPNRDKRKPPTEARGYSVEELQRSSGELNYWLRSSVGQALQRRFYFLVGPAGSGKTHLFLDATRRALDDARPAVTLFGGRFGRGDLWASICDQLGLEPLGADVLLGAMDATAEASATSGRRFVILVDALNETVPPDFWVTHLPVLRSAVARWPHIALAVSCRDTYVEIVDEGAESRHYVKGTHPGFAGREVEATQRYFDHYGLETPRIPLLTPEFSLPLFLRLYCESLRDSGQATVATGHEGRVRIFHRYLEAKLTRVARRLRPAAATSYELSRAKSRASAVVKAKALVDEFARTGREGSPVDRVETLATDALDGSSEDAAIVLGALQSEGVLIREFLYLGDDGSAEGFRIAFQAFADYLILRRRLERLTDPTHDAEFRQWLLEECSWGIVEAAAVVLPELYGVELPDLLKLTPSSLQNRPDPDDDRARRRSGRARNAFRSLIETLPYRDSAAVTDRTLELLNQGRRVVSADELFRTLFLIAPQPDNRLNAETLHGYLLQQKMPRRDAFLGIATYHEIWEEASPAATLSRWASHGPYPDYDAKVIELATTPLLWLMSSPNRFMRDWVTKALVQLLRGHLDVMRKLLERFWTVDDPYIVQRVVVIAYGSLLRSEPANRAEARKLVKRVKDLVFTTPIRADEILLDAGRGIVEWGVAHKVLGRRALDDIKRPYGLKPPGNPPSKATLEKKYGFRENQPDEESYSTIFFSLMSMGDFGRYVVEAGMHYFSRYKHGVDYPSREPREPRLIKSRLKAFEGSLTRRQRAQLEEIVAANDGETDPSGVLDPKMNRFLSSLSKRQSDLFEASWRRPRIEIRNDEYPAERAQRWVFGRTLSLGWKPRLFGRADRVIRHGRVGREAHKAERWGKKYQWMAYHELLARVADNFHPSRMYGERGTYEGLHQIIAKREIDPSLPPIEYREFAEESGEAGSTWRPSLVTASSWPPAQIDFRRYRGSIDAFIDDRESEPTLDRVSILNDDAGDSWVLLDAYISQGDPQASKSWLGLQQNLALNSWFVPRDEARELLPNLADLRRQRFHDLVDSHGHVDCCYMGEIGWIPHSCYNRHADFTEIEFANRTWKLVSTVEDYTWEGSLLDCSIGESVTATLPSTFVQKRSSLLFDDRGPSWFDVEGRVAFTNIGGKAERGRGFLVRWSWLKPFLDEHGLELMVASWYERRFLDGPRARAHRWEDVVSAARVDGRMTVHLSEGSRDGGR